MLDNIETAHDYHAALMRIEELMDSEIDTPEGEELDVLVTLVEKYEGENWAEPQFRPTAERLKEITQSGAEALANMSEEDLGKFLET